MCSTKQRAISTIESEAIIMANIKALSREKAVIVISHRLANVTPADLIYYMESGELKESGTHSELMERNSGYAKALYHTEKSRRRLCGGGSMSMSKKNNLRRSRSKNNGKSYPAARQSCLYYGTCRH